MIKTIQKITNLFNRKNDDVEHIENNEYIVNTITNDVKMTADSWSLHYDTIVISPTGFPNVNEFDWDKTLLTEKQFLEYAEYSTIKFNDKINSAFDMLKYERLKNLA